jgi:hypothetical protein
MGFVSLYPGFQRPPEIGHCGFINVPLYRVNLAPKEDNVRGTTSGLIDGAAGST